MLLYFTSGTTAKPKLVRHSQRSYPVGASVDDVLARACSPATCISTSPRRAGPSTPGAASSRRGMPARPIFIVNQPRFDAKALLATIGRCGVTTLCAPPTVWRLFIQEKLADLQGVVARGLRRRRAAQSRSDRSGAGGMGPDHPRRLRPDRDHGAGRQLAGPKSEGRLDGPAAAGLSRADHRQ